MCLVLLLIGLGGFVGDDVTAQESLDPNYRAPRTIDQVPDISGIWKVSNVHVTSERGGRHVT